MVEDWKWEPPVWQAAVSYARQEVEMIEMKSPRQYWFEVVEQTVSGALGVAFAGSRRDLDWDQLSVCCLDVAQLQAALGSAPVVAVAVVVVAAAAAVAAAAVAGPALPFAARD